MATPLYPSPRFPNRAMAFATQAMTLSATTTLVWNDPGTNQVQLIGRQLYVTASGAARILVLPDMEADGRCEGIELVVKAITNQVTVKTTGSAATVAVIPAGSACLITMKSNTVYSAVMGSGSGNFGAAGIAADVIAESTSAAGVTVDGLLLKDGYLTATDNQGLKLGTGVDDTLIHNGTDTIWTHATGALLVDNTNTTGFTVLRLGTDTSATKYEVRNDSDQALFTIYGNGTILAGPNMWNGCPSPASHEVKAHVFFDDFHGATFDAANWVVTEDDVADTQAVGDAVYGVVTLTCKAATDDDANQITWAQETFRLNNGKKLWFEARIRCPAGATEIDWFVGLCEAEDLTGVADNMPANGVGFHKDDGSTTIKCSSSDGGTDVQNTNVGTLASDTWTKIGFYFDGATSVTPWVNDVAQTALTVTYATMAEMAVMFMVRNGDAVTTQALDVDYVKVVMQR